MDAVFLAGRSDDQAALGMQGDLRAAIVAQAAMTAGLVLFISLTALEMTIVRFGRPRYLAAALAGFAGEFFGRALSEFSTGHDGVGSAGGGGLVVAARSAVE